jgi:hypothetical protein
LQTTTQASTVDLYQTSTEILSCGIDEWFAKHNLEYNDDSPLAFNTHFLKRPFSMLKMAF